MVGFISQSDLAQGHLVYPETAVPAPNEPYHQATLGELIERRRYEIQGYVQTLREAHRICSDKSLMAEIRMYVQDERDALASILDYIDLPR